LFAEKTSCQKKSQKEHNQTTHKRNQFSEQRAPSTKQRNIEHKLSGKNQTKFA